MKRHSISDWPNEAWERELEAVISRRSELVHALTVLEEQGIERGWLFSGLYLYVQSFVRAKSESLSRQKKAKDARRRVDRCLTMLPSLIDNLNVIARIGRLEAIPDVFRQEPDFKPYTKTLSALANELRCQRESFLALSSKGKARFDLAIVIVCEGVKAHTGRAHLESVAKLLEAALNAAGEFGNLDEPLQITADRLRKTITRYRESHPTHYSRLMSGFQKQGVRFSLV